MSGLQGSQAYKILDLLLKVAETLKESELRQGIHDEWSFQHLRELRVSLGGAVSPRRRPASPSLLVAKELRAASPKSTGMKTPQELTEALGFCLHWSPMFSFPSTPLP